MFDYLKSIYQESKISSLFFIFICASYIYLQFMGISVFNTFATERSKPSSYGSGVRNHHRFYHK